MISEIKIFILSRVYTYKPKHVFHDDIFQLRTDGKQGFRSRELS